MARAPRIDVGDYVYHVLNRANGKAQMFRSAEEYRDFEYLLNEIKETFDMRILAYVIMPNHWHLLLYPKQDGDVGRSLHWLTTSHVRRHHARKGTVGHGHLYQGTYKSFIVKDDRHLLTVLKYIERNPARAKLVKKAEEWRWGSAYRRIRGTKKERQLLAESPTPVPRDYGSWVNESELSEDLDDIRKSVSTGSPYGDIRIL
jgi:putative transposase